MFPNGRFKGIQCWVKPACTVGWEAPGPRAGACPEATLPIFRIHQPQFPLAHISESVPLNELARFRGDDWGKSHLTLLLQRPSKEPPPLLHPRWPPEHRGGEA